MASIQCPECGKELLGNSSEVMKDHCICTQCGRNVYGRNKRDVKVTCPSCGKENKTSVIF